MAHDVQDHLNYILRAIETVRFYTIEGKAAFFTDRKTMDATLYQLQTLAESSMHIDPAIRDRESHIEWKKIKGFRNVIVHEYLGELDIETVWNVIEKDIHPLYDALKPYDTRETP
jgi:uncharacterized protein with HEPN domain